MTKVTAQLIGFPRIGPHRELKWALEHAWSGRLDRVEPDHRITELRHAHLDEQRDLIGSATVGTHAFKMWRRTSRIGSPGHECATGSERAPLGKVLAGAST
jgi:hypothetical protein